jgi:hypothetical protein
VIGARANRLSKGVGQAYGFICCLYALRVYFCMRFMWLVMFGFYRGFYRFLFGLVIDFLARFAIVIDEGNPFAIA